MITFGGSPTGVAVPPTLEKMTIVIRMGTGFRPITSHNLIVTGVIRSIVVTLSRNADKIPVNKARHVIKGHTLPLVIYENSKIKITARLYFPTFLFLYLVSENRQKVENASF